MRAQLEAWDRPEGLFSAPCLGVQLPSTALCTAEIISNSLARHSGTQSTFILYGCLWTDCRCSVVHKQHKLFYLKQEGQIWLCLLFVFRCHWQKLYVCYLTELNAESLQCDMFVLSRVQLWKKNSTPVSAVTWSLLKQLVVEMWDISEQMYSTNFHIIWHKVLPKSTKSECEAIPEIN